MPSFGVCLYTETDTIVFESEENVYTQEFKEING